MYVSNKHLIRLACFNWRNAWDLERV